jgi:RNA polymerase sigma-70 factor (ECF subfamily)
MTVNHCLDVLKSAQRRRQKTHLDIVEQVNIKANTADQAVHAQELHVLIQEAASGLTPKQKAVFILRDLEGLPAEEVGRILSMAPQNIKSNLYYARQQVCERLRKIYQTTDKITTV